MSYIPNKNMNPLKGSLSPGRRRQIPSATDEDRAKAVYPGDKSNASVGLLRKITDNTDGPVKPSGKLYKHNYTNPFGPEEGERAPTAYPGSHWTSEEELLSIKDGTNPYSDNNVHELNANRELPNKSNYGRHQREYVAYHASDPFIRAQERREAAEYAKKSCWEKLMDCFKSKSEKNRRGGSIGGADVTIEDLRDFLDANQDIKNILVNDECPLDPTEQMNDDADKFTDMLEKYENPYITIDEIYNQDAGKRRKKTRKAKRRPRKTKKSKRRTKRTKRRN